MTPIDPPPGLLDKVADAIRDPNASQRTPRLEGEHVTDWEARAAWDAVAEGLGLREALIFGGRRHLVSEPLEPQP